METRSEADLLRAVQAFDMQALGEIYDRYSPALYGYALKLLGDPCLAEDCVAETFSRFLKALRFGSGPQQHLRAYLYRVAHNWITDQYRRQPPPPLDLDENCPDLLSISPELSVARRLEQQRTRAALRLLTPEQRQVIILRFIEGWGSEEVAAAVQKPVGAVKALQHRGLETLRKLLTAQEGNAYVYKLQD